jgi:hypothetical protein
MSADVQAILKFYMRILRGCNVGITEVRELSIRWG